MYHFHIGKKQTDQYALFYTGGALYNCKSCNDPILRDKEHQEIVKFTRILLHN